MWAYPWTVIPPTTVRLLTSGKLPAALLSLYLWAIKPACCGAEIDVDSTAFVSSLANSKSIFLTFFYLLSSHNLPLCPPSLLLLYLCYSSVHLYSAQTWVSPIASISYLVIFFPRFFLCCVSPAGLSPSICLFFCISLPPPPLPHLLLVPIHLPGSQPRVHIQWMIGIVWKLFDCMWVWDNSNIWRFARVKEW